MKNIARMRPLNDAPTPRYDTRTFGVFIILALLFVALAATEIIVSVRSPQHAAALATAISPFLMAVVFLLGFAIGKVLR